MQNQSTGIGSSMVKKIGILRSCCAATFIFSILSINTANANINANTSKNSNSTLSGPVSTPVNATAPEKDPASTKATKESEDVKTVNESVKSIKAVKAVSPTISNKQAIKLSYSQVAAAFHVLDQLSESLPAFFHIPEYKDVWRSQFGLSAEDEVILSAYQKVRQKYQKIPKGFEGEHTTESGLFAPNPADLKDPIFDAFFSEDTYEQATSKLSGIVEKSDIDIINKAFVYFSDKIKSFIKEDAKKIVADRLEFLNKALENPKLAQHFNKMTQFYSGKLGPFKSVRLIWIPEAGGFSGVSYGDHLFLRFPFDMKEVDNGTLEFLATALVHEATHHISGTAPATQKQALSEVFLKKIGQIKDPHMLLALEEPLVMATQAYYIKTSDPKLYEERKDWLSHPLSEKYLIALEETLSAGKKLDQEFIARCAEIYLTQEKSHDEMHE